MSWSTPRTAAQGWASGEGLLQCYMAAFSVCKLCRLQSLDSDQRKHLLERQRADVYEPPQPTNGPSGGGRLVADKVSATRRPECSSLRLREPSQSGAEAIAAKSCCRHSDECRVVNELVAAARTAGCYKVILDCSNENVDFYAKAGFQRKEVHMACHRPPSAFASSCCPASIANVTAPSVVAGSVFSEVAADRHAVMTEDGHD